MTFNPPSNPDHVSHSIVFSTGKGSVTSLDVKAVRFDSLLAQYAIKDVALLKLDIEGAEYAVLKGLGGWPVVPQQILVEYDIASEGKQKVEEIDALLRQNGYICFAKEGRNCSYLHGDFAG